MTQFPDVDADAMSKNWPEYGSRIKSVMKINYKTDVPKTGWPELVEQVLALIKIFPQKGGRGVKVPFTQATERVIVHSEVISQILCTNFD